MIFSCPSESVVAPIRFAGTWSRYSNNATPQLRSAATYHGRSARVFRWPYHAYVMNRFDKTRRIIVFITTGIGLMGRGFWPNSGFAVCSNVRYTLQTSPVSAQPPSSNARSFAGPSPDTHARRRRLLHRDSGEEPDRVGRSPEHSCRGRGRSAVHGDNRTGA